MNNFTFAAGDQSEESVKPMSSKKISKAKADKKDVLRFIDFYWFKFSFSYSKFLFLFSLAPFFQLKSPLIDLDIDNSSTSNEDTAYNKASKTNTVAAKCKKRDWDDDAWDLLNQ